jgi:hypothetical protein
MRMSAGFFFSDPNCSALRLAKLMGGVDRELALGSAEFPGATGGGGGCVCTTRGVGEGGRGGCWLAEFVGAGGCRRGPGPTGATVAAVAMLGLRREGRDCFDGGAGLGRVGLVVTVLGDMTPTTLPLRCSMRAFCCCLTVKADFTCSNAFGLSLLIVNPITTGEIGVELV